MRRSPLVLTVFAVVLAALAAGATAFVVKDKTVRVDVDGRVVAVHTFAGDVGGVLHKAGIAVGEHDTVAPAVDASVRNGSRVVVRHGRLVTLTLDGQRREIWVTALSVDDALDQLGLRDSGAWLSVSRSLAIPRSGLALELRRPHRVTVVADGHRYTRTTTAPSVAEVLAQLRLHLGSTDSVSVPLDRYPTDGLVIAVTRVTTTTTTRSVALAFRTVERQSSTLYRGQSQVSRAGRAGVRVDTYRVVRRNGKVVKSALVSRRVTVRPVDQILLVGTKARPAPRTVSHSASADGLNWPALARCESGGNPRSVSSGGTYRGLYQFSMGTWHGVGGVGDPIDASSSEQTYRAQILYGRSGTSPWPVCGHYLYS